MEQEFVNMLILTAKRKIAADDEDFCAYDYSGGNSDDAYYLGYEDGQIAMARDILDSMGIEY